MWGDSQVNIKTLHSGMGSDRRACRAHQGGVVQGPEKAPGQMLKAEESGAGGVSAWESAETRSRKADPRGMGGLVIGIVKPGT